MSFVEKNPKFCKTFTNYYQFECLSCPSNRSLHANECVLTCPPASYSNDYGIAPNTDRRCEPCPVGCLECSEINRAPVCSNPSVSELRLRAIDVHPLKQIVTYCFDDSLAEDSLEFLDFGFPSEITEEVIKILSVKILNDRYI